MKNEEESRANLSGLNCPLPVLKTKKLSSMNAGENYLFA